MPSVPITIFTPPSAPTPGAAGSVFVPPSAGSPPGAAGAVFVPPSAGSPPGAAGAVFVPPSAGSPPGAAGAVFVPPAPAAPSFDRMTVAGILPVGANGEYVASGTSQGKPMYVKDSNAIMWIPTLGGYWTISPSPISGGFSARGYQDVATPDLVTTWVNPATTLPVAVTVTSGGGPPVIFTP